MTVNRAVVTGGSVRRRKRRALRDRLLPIVGPLILIGLWWLTSATGILNAKLVPAPGPTLVTTWNALLHGTMLHDLVQTQGRGGAAGIVQGEHALSMIEHVVEAEGAEQSGGKSGGD